MKLLRVVTTLLTACVLNVMCVTFVHAQDDGRATGVTSHVVVISIDGLRADAIARYQASNLLRLQREGAAGTAQTVFPSRTLPSHTSMLTGVLPEVHGITWNADAVADSGYVAFPTIFEIAREHGYITAGFFAKAKLRHLQRPGSFDYTQAPVADNWPAIQTVNDLRRYLKTASPNLLFVHIGEPDYAGHEYGWMSKLYGWAVRRADRAVGNILKAVNDRFGAGNYTVIVTADHGGHDIDHGTTDPADMTIPWIAWGRGVERDHIEMPLSTIDTAPTVLWLLGIPWSPGWSGHPVADAFTEAAQHIADEAIEAELSKAGVRH